MGEYVVMFPATAAGDDRGPYAETVEQLSGFFRVACDDYDALVEAAQVLTRVHPVVEIRLVQQF